MGGRWPGCVLGHLGDFLSDVCLPYSVVKANDRSTPKELDRKDAMLMQLQSQTREIPPSLLHSLLRFFSWPLWGLNVDWLGFDDDHGFISRLNVFIDI